jgi:hypothetical protein
LLLFKKGEKTSTLTSKLFYRDDTLEDFTDTNKGYAKRKGLAAESRTFDMLGKVRVF